MFSIRYKHLTNLDGVTNKGNKKRMLIIRNNVEMELFKLIKGPFNFRRAIIILLLNEKARGLGYFSRLVMYKF